jgi:signal transduction histidine kinase
MRRLQNQDPNILQEKSVEKLLTTTSRQVDRLARLVEDMLDISRIAHGKLRFDFETVDLGALVRDVVDRFHDQLSASSANVTLNIDEGVSGQWDRYRIEQVFINLITNSMKYGAGNPISVSVRNDGERAIIQVIDQGVGIAKESLARIFERFERAISGESITGLGLGLYISKQIVNAHHGEISVESELGKGSTFTVVLPKDPTKLSD